MALKCDRGWPVTKASSENSLSRSLWNAMSFLFMYSLST